MFSRRPSYWFFPEIFGPDPETEYNPAIIRRNKSISSLLRERPIFRTCISSQLAAR
jgi:hypothetical protein